MATTFTLKRKIFATVAIAGKSIAGMVQNRGASTMTKVAPGVKEDTTYKGGVGVKLDGDTKGISVSGGKTTKKSEGINYQTHGTEHKVSIEGSNKDGNKKLEGSYTNKKTDGNGVKIGKVDVSNTNTKEN